MLHEEETKSSLAIFQDGFNTHGNTPLVFEAPFSLPCLGCLSFSGAVCFICSGCPSFWLCLFVTLCIAAAKVSVFCSWIPFLH